VVWQKFGKCSSHKLPWNRAIDKSEEQPPTRFVRAGAVSAAICTLNSLLWLVLFLNPRLGYIDQLVIPVFLVIGAGMVANVVGFIVIARLFWNGATAFSWSLLAIFSVNPILNILGFLWGVGMGRPY
jgi:hypothetical protein